HSWEASRRNTFSPPATEEQKQERPPVTHPIVRTHPDTGRKLLYIGIHTSHIEGMPEGEGRALLYRLLDFASQPRFVHTHKWRLGDLVMWDNRCLVHRAAGDFEMGKYPRVLHRTVIRGSVPY
ncbi:MAG: TauD/TfdA family dioxygenase, partial [Alphaproteobacteria bacterium]|nr:TauD/TfdA family dioxygenase [Alphaproteobacteria bacterium]